MIVLILLLGLAIRLINLNQSLWLDEAIEVLAVKNNSYYNLITKYAIGDFHPPFYHVILKFWTIFFGYSEISARIPSVLLGVLTCYFVFLIGRKLFSQKVGFIAALFLAINPLAVYYSQEARMYSLAAFAVTAAFYFFLENKWRLFVFFFALALYTDYLTWLILPVFFLLAREKRTILKSYILIFILLLPWLPCFWQQLHMGTSVVQNIPLWGQVVGGFSLKSLLLVPVKFIFGRISIEDKILYAAVFGVVSTYYVWLIIRTKSKVLWYWFLLPILLGFVISLKIPIFSYFRFLFVLPALVLLLAGKAGKAALVLITIISLISLTTFNLNPKFQRENWREAVAYFQSDPGLVLLPNLAQSAPISYYNPHQPIQDKNSVQLESVRTVYLLRYVQEIFDPQDSLRRNLEISGYNKMAELNFNSLLVWKYSR